MGDNKESPRTDSVPNESDVLLRDMDFWEALGETHNRAHPIHHRHTVFSNLCIRIWSIRLSIMYCICQTPPGHQYCILLRGDLIHFMKCSFSSDVVTCCCKFMNRIIIQCSLIIIFMLLEGQQIYQLYL